ncbi:hypothetical protein M9H77_03648 [Catharanthus roseus]|uniref:Uncharacterized protein n=1 Tax=Catharanthus roseus TaxID=4058 RepID=A0ACC0CC10_CATRO|nr:hypothetical protein M9H77_03648 [Catharanthus roseus]
MTPIAAIATVVLHIPPVTRCALLQWRHDSTSSCACSRRRRKCRLDLANFCMHRSRFREEGVGGGRGRGWVWGEVFTRGLGTKDDVHSALAIATITGVDEAGARIFGHILNPTGQRSGHKWYPHDIKHDDPLVMARQEQERLSKLKMLKCQEKGPPKKGQGKQTAKCNRK